MQGGGGNADATQIQERCLNVLDVPRLAQYRANHLVSLAQQRAKSSPKTSNTETNPHRSYTGLSRPQSPSACNCKLGNIVATKSARQIDPATPITTCTFPRSPLLCSMLKCSTTPSMLIVNGARTRLRKWQNSHERGLLRSSRLFGVAEARLGFRACTSTFCWITVRVSSCAHCMSLCCQMSPDSEYA